MTQDKLNKNDKNFKIKLKKRTAELEKINKQLMHENEERIKTEKKLLNNQIKLRMITAELSLAEERERRRIALDIHDSIGQSLAIIKIKLKALKSSTDSKEINKKLDEILEYTEQTIQETRSLSHELSSSVLYTFGLEPAVVSLIENIEQKHNLNIKFINDEKSKPLSDPSKIHLFRSIREIMFNIIKHANAKNVKVEIIRQENDICISIEDDGCGFTQVNFQPDSGGGFGLSSIRERLIHLGGSFVIHSEPGKGTQVVLSAPLEIIKPIKK